MSISLSAPPGIPSHSIIVSVLAASCLSCLSESHNSHKYLYRDRGYLLYREIHIFSTVCYSKRYLVWYIYFPCSWKEFENSLTEFNKIFCLIDSSPLNMRRISSDHNNFQRIIVLFILRSTQTHYATFWVHSLHCRSVFSNFDIDVHQYSRQLFGRGSFKDSC